MNELVRTHSYTPVQGQDERTCAPLLDLECVCLCVVLFFSAVKFEKVTGKKKYDLIRHVSTVPVLSPLQRGNSGLVGICGPTRITGTSFVRDCQMV